MNINKCAFSVRLKLPGIFLNSNGGCWFMCCKRNYSIILNDQLGIIWKELVMTYIIISQGFSGGG